MLQITFRQPVALFKDEQGGLEYLDSSGRVFGDFTLSAHQDFPTLSGIPPRDERALVRALHVLRVSGGILTAARSGVVISGLRWEADQGYRLLVTYPLLSDPGIARGVIDLGSLEGGDLPNRLEKVRQVLSYLSRRGIEAHQIWADADKKVVVRTSRGS